MKKTILVIDDQEYITSSLKFSFEKEGFKVFISSNGEHALKSLDKNNVDMIITDIYMPKMDGIEFINTIRSKEKYKEIPIIVLTTDIKTKEESKKAGATGWLSKPFSTQKMIDVVNKVLK